MKKYVKPLINIFYVQAKHNMLVGSDTLDITNDPADINSEILSKEDKDNGNESIFGW